MEKYQDPNFGERLKKARGKLTQGELALAAEVSQSTIAKYEKGLIPQANILKRISDALHTSMEYLLTGSPEQTEGVFEKGVAYKTASPNRDRDIEAAVELMEKMDVETKKLVLLAIRKELLLLELLNKRG